MFVIRSVEEDACWNCSHFKLSQDPIAFSSDHVIRIWIGPDILARDFHILTTKSLKAQLGRSCGWSLNCLSPNSFPLVILNSFFKLWQDVIALLIPHLLFSLSPPISAVYQRDGQETPHPLDNPCNNYFGISCFATVTITHSIAISIAMALVPFNLIGLPKGLMPIKPFLDHFLALGSSVFSPSLVLSISTLYTRHSIIHLQTIISMFSELNINHSNLSLDTDNVTLRYPSLVNSSHSGSYIQCFW